MAQDINHLFKKLLNNQCSAQELDELLGNMNDEQYKAVYERLILNQLAEPVAHDEVSDDLRERLNARLNQILGTPASGITTDINKKPTVKLWLRITAAAAVLLVVGAGLFFYTSYYSPRHLDNKRDLLNYTNDVAPGKNTATITLSNGRRISLSDAKTGVVVKASGLRYNDGTAVDPSRDLSGTAEMTEVATPRGGTYQITLPDGTKVWLNAASNLSFPSTFQGLGIRKVELSGEAYFEVAKDKKHPFIVLTEKQEVEVLGTHFNINSYADELSTKTTLLEGSVSVRHLDDKRNEGKAVILKPGEQANLTTNNRIRVTDADLAEVTAWKNGDFLFKTEDFKTIMRKVARWYNVDIVFDASAPTNLSLGGVVSRNKNISAVLKIMEATGDVHFKIEGRRITVTK